MNIEQAVAHVLKKYRSSLGISQEKLAHRCSLDRTFISLIERGKRKPTLNTIFLISNELNVKPSTFVQEVEELLNEDSQKS